MAAMASWPGTEDEHFRGPELSPQLKVKPLPWGFRSG